MPMTLFGVCTLHSHGGHDPPDFFFKLRSTHLRTDSLLQAYQVGHDGQSVGRRRLGRPRLPSRPAAAFGLVIRTTWD